MSDVMRILKIKKKQFFPIKWSLYNTQIIKIITRNKKGLIFNRQRIQKTRIIVVVFNPSTVNVTSSYLWINIQLYTWNPSWNSQKPKSWKLCFFLGKNIFYGHFSATSVHCIHEFFKYVPFDSRNWVHACCVSISVDDPAAIR